VTNHHEKIGVYKYLSDLSGFSGISGAGEVYINTSPERGSVFKYCYMAVFGAGEAGEVFNLYTLPRRRRRIYIQPEKWKLINNTNRLFENRMTGGF